MQRINCTMCFVVGGALNATLIWLICKRSGGELRDYSRVLLQTVAVDLAYLTVSFLHIPVGGPGDIGVGLEATHSIHTAQSSSSRSLSSVTASCSPTA